MVRRNAIEVSHTRFNADSERLIGAVEKILESVRAEEQRKREEQERVDADKRKREEEERLAAERRETELKERLEHRQKEERDRPETDQGEKERLEAKQREKERPKAEGRQRDEKEPLEHLPQSQLPSPVTLPTPLAPPEAGKPYAETPEGGLSAATKAFCARAREALPPAGIMALLAFVFCLVVGVAMYLRHPDKHWVVTGSYDKTARLWDLNAKDPASPVILSGHDDPVIAVALR